MAKSKKRRTNGDDSGDPPPTPPPSPPVSTPEIALQIRASLAANAGCLKREDAEEVRRTIEDVFRRQFPAADVRSACVKTREGVSATTVGIWTRPSVPGGEEARDRGLRKVEAIK